MFASALWSADLMYQLASAGGTGINFHGGGYGWYTPIAGTQEDGFVARPIYYGMLLFAQAGAGQLVGSKLDQREQALLLTAYGIRNDAGKMKERPSTRALPAALASPSTRVNGHRAYARCVGTRRGSTTRPTPPSAGPGCAEAAHGRRRGKNY
jgi:hypothetical protein